MSIDLSNRSVALIGGAGFIGHHLALKLKEYGAEVNVIDSLQVNNLVKVSANHPNKQNRDIYLDMIHDRIELLHEHRIPLHVQDARDYQALSSILVEIKPDVIIHLAAVAHAGKSNKDPFSTFDHTQRTLENALDYARELTDQFIFFSSSMVYGNFEEDEVVEEDRLDPVGIYGALKVGGEKLVNAYKNVFDMDYTIVRPSALYGPRCISRRVVQIFIENALDGDPLKIEGEGDDKLDFTYIKDLIEGIALVIDKPEARNEIFNLTYGEARSIKDLAEVVQSEFPEIEIQHRERDELKPKRGTLNVSKARENIGYSPEFPIERGVKEYISWYKKYTDLTSS